MREPVAPTRTNTGQLVSQIIVCVRVPVPVTVTDKLATHHATTL